LVVLRKFMFYFYNIWSKSVLWHWMQIYKSKAKLSNCSNIFIFMDFPDFCYDCCLQFTNRLRLLLCTLSLRCHLQIKIWGWSLVTAVLAQCHNSCGFFCPTPEVQLNTSLRCNPKLGIVTHACWDGTISFKTLIETDNSCCAPQFAISIGC